MNKLPWNALDIGPDIFKNLRENNVWKRMVKNIAATTLLVSVCLIPGARDSIGRAAYLGAIITVFAHPGRRFGQMAEALILALGGAVLGVAWSILGIFLGSLAIKGNQTAAYAIRAIFLVIATMTHGFLRSKAPRLFIFVLVLIIVSVVSLSSVQTTVTSGAATQILYPVLIAGGVILLVNLFILPEFSSSFLGETVIKTLNDTTNALAKAGGYFMMTDELTKPNEGEKFVNKKDTPDSNRERNTLEACEEIEHQKRTGLLTPFKNLQNRNSTKAEEPTNKDAYAEISLSRLTANKGDLRTGLANCKAAQRECNFEVAFSVLPPQNMKSISSQAMKRLVANVIAVIGACESKYAFTGDADHNNESETKPGDVKPLSHSLSRNTGSLKSSNIEHPPSLRNSMVVQQMDGLGAKNDDEFGSSAKLHSLIELIKSPYTKLSHASSLTVDKVIACVAYAYNVPKLPSGARVPESIAIEEIDQQIESLGQALLTFDTEAAWALEGAALVSTPEHQSLKAMPREDIFLISSFLLNYRQAIAHIHSMLKSSRNLVFDYQQRRGHRRVYAPRIKWSKWFYTGGEEEEALPANSRKAIRQGVSDEGDEDVNNADITNETKGLLGLRQNRDLENTGGFDQSGIEITKLSEPFRKTSPATRGQQLSEPSSSWMHLRSEIANILEWVQYSDDILYATKLTTAVFLVLWPAFVPSWSSWYSLNRGLWAALQLIFITEVSIGTSVMTFVLRGIGTTLGCLWGWAAWEIHGGNRIVCAATICVGLIPATYVQLGTKYPKAGMVSIVSMCVVALATELETVPGTATENFLKRWIAFMIGGTVALIVELTLLPVKARTRMVELLAATIGQIIEMENCVASGIEEGASFDVFNNEVFAKFEHASGKANTALNAAETFLPFCSTEPRIKGSFQTLALIYKEIIFVLHQIVDRMENLFHLRTAYGSGPLEEFNPEIYPYRRNVAGSISLILFAVRGALTTKLPLPQFLPSARLAYLRMISRVKEVMTNHSAHMNDDQKILESFDGQQRTLVRRKYISWHAASAAQAEVIEYLEELIDLTKLLVGASEFRSGLLMRPNYADLVETIDKGARMGEQQRGDSELNLKLSSGPRERRGTVASGQEGDAVPLPLRRIQSRKVQQGLQREGTIDGSEHRNQ